MRYAERDDAELVALAQAGWGPAFAVLVHRHAPLLLAAFADDRDPWGRTLTVLVRALKRLDRHDPTEPFGDWLLTLAKRERPASVPAADAEELDALWWELDVRWPDGKRPRRVPAFVRGTALVIGAVGLGVAVPAAVISTTPEETLDAVELRAQPISNGPVDGDDADLDGADPTPTLEFPEDEDAVDGEDAPVDDEDTSVDGPDASVDGPDASVDGPDASVDDDTTP